MYTVSDKFKEVVQSNAVVATARIILVADNTVIDGNDLTSVTIRDYCNNDGVIIGTAMSKEVEIELINRGYDLADKEFLLEVGIEVDTDTIEYISYGNFTVKEYTDMKSNNKYKIVAYDYMDKLNKEFTDNNTYPMTLQAFYEALATQYGVQIETQTLPNKDFVVEEKPFFEGSTGRTVLTAIAQMFGSFAKFNRNNKLQMYLKNETNETISRDQMNSVLEIDNRYGPINTVVLSLGNVEGENKTLKDEESVATYGETILEIVDNPFVYTEELRSKAIQGIYDRVLGFTYIPTSFNYKAYLYLDCGDAVQVQQMNTDDYVDTIILNQEIKVPATRQSKCTNTALTKTQVQNQYVSPEKQAQRKTEIMVDKQNGIIEALSTSVKDNSTKIAQLVIEDTKISQRVSSTEERIETAEEDIEETNKAIDSLDNKLTDEVANLQGQIDGQIQFWNGPTIPTLNNEPAINWETEEQKNNHRADIYTVIEDVDGELKQGKSYRFDKVGTNWVWVELTDNELSAVQALAASKAKVFVTQPKVPYNVGDLWLKDKELYECVTAKDTNGSFALIDWQKATKYTDDTIALLAQQAADKAIDNQTTTNITEEAKTFYLPDSADNYCKSAEIFGESTQETRSGRNEFDISKVVWGKYDCYPNITGNYIDAFYSKFEIKPNTDYILTCENAITATRYSYKILDENDNVLSGRYDSAPSTIKKIWRFTTESNAKYIVIAQLDTLQANVNNLKIQLAKGTEEKPYEPYGVMPSPEFPSEIESVSGNNIFKGEFRQGDAAEFASQLKLRLYTKEDTLVKAGKTYTISTDLDTSIMKYAINISAVPHPTYNQVFDSGWLTVKSYTFTATVDGYLGVPIAKLNATDEIALEEIAGIKWQIVEGTVAIPYRPYNNLAVMSGGENLLKITNDLATEFPKTVNDLTISVNEDGSFQVVGTNSTSDFTTFYFATKPTILKAGVTYYTTMSLSCYKVKDSSWYGNVGQRKITPTEDLKFTGCYWATKQQGEVNITILPMLVVGDTEPKEFAPYREESITTIPLLHDMRSLPNGVRDRIYESNDKWYDEQNVDKIVLNGTENSWGYSEEKKRFSITYKNAGMKFADTKRGYVEKMCSHFKYYPLNATGKTATGLYENGTNENYSFLMFIYPEITTLEDWKSWLAVNNVEIIYELDEPIVTEITDEATITALESIKTFKGITNITADAPSVLTYYRDVPLNYEFETQQSAQKQYKITEEKFAQQEITDDQIKATVQTLTTKVTEEYATKTELSTQIAQTDNKIQFEINKSIQDLKDNGVPKVVSKIVTINDKGMTVGDSENEFTNTMNNTGNYQYNAGVLVAKYDKDGADIPRLKSDLAIIAGIKYTKETIGETVHHKQYVIE